MKLAQGVVISTTIQRDSFTKDIRVKTLPCTVQRVGGTQERPSKILKFVLTEGRNRQIRKMCAEVNLDVEELHRVIFKT